MPFNLVRNPIIATECKRIELKKVTDRREIEIF